MCTERARRRELIDNIVAGSEPIERVPPVWANREDTVAGEDDITTLNNRSGDKASVTITKRAVLSFPALLGAGSLLCLIVFVVLLMLQPSVRIVLQILNAIPTASEALPTRSRWWWTPATCRASPEGLRLASSADALVCSRPPTRGSAARATKWWDGSA